MTERSKKVFERNCIETSGMNAFPVHIVIDLLEANERLEEALEAYKGKRAVRLTVPDSTLSWLAADEALAANDELMAKLAGEK